MVQGFCVIHVLPYRKPLEVCVLNSMPRRQLYTSLCRCQLAEARGISRTSCTKQDFLFRGLIVHHDTAVLPHCSTLLNIEFRSVKGANISVCTSEDARPRPVKC